MLTRFLFPLLFFISGVCVQIYAQDTIPKPDSILLKELRLYPKKNSLPVRIPNLILKPVTLPSPEIDIRMNYWRNWLSFGINFNQASFSGNWSSGGVNTLALGTQFNFKTDYTQGDKNFVSEVLLEYGKLKNKGQLERKIRDRIFWDNKGGLKLSKSWNFFGSLTLESQFDFGYSYSKNAEGKEISTPLSRFMSPGYLTESVGFEYKPVPYFFLRIGTGTARQTFVLDTGLYRTNPKNFGVTPGKKIRNELAFQIVASIDKDISTNLNLKSRYALFASYDRISGIDHRLDFTLTAKVNRLINVAVSGVALYDDDTDNKIQASQMLSLGLIYQLNR